jgi:hypothetical protein
MQGIYIAIKFGIKVGIEIGTEKRPPKLDVLLAASPKPT